MSAQEKLKSLMADLAQERDELRVKANLAGKELRDEWEEAEEMFQNLKNRSKSVGQHLAEAGEEAADASGDVWEATTLLAEEVGNLFKRVRSKLS